MATATTRLTYQDLQQIPPDRNRYELIEGELFVAPAPNIEHPAVSIEDSSSQSVQLELITATDEE
jgi:Uma2 family endonuclease